MSAKEKVKEEVSKVNGSCLGNKISDRKLITEFKSLNYTMGYCYGSKDVMRLEMIRGMLEDRGFEMEEYTDYHITLNNGNPVFDAKGNAIREDDEDD